MSTITTRPASPEDAASMSCLLNAIIAKGGTTAHTTPFDRDRMTDHYILSPDLVCCTVALEGNQIVGFQTLHHADPNWPGDDKVPEGWAIIASFVAEGQQGKGIGKHLFAATLAAAKAAGVQAIDATIRTYNTPGLAYYRGLGFVDYRQTDQSISKKFVVEPAI